MNPTKLDAETLAKKYLKRLESGEFSCYTGMHNSILANVVNNKYTRNSNYFIDYLWSYIHKNTN